MSGETKKVALVTCYFQPNFGSQLQAYATKKIFDDLGVPNETICIDGLKPEINRAKMRYFVSRIWDINTIKDKWATVRKVVAKKRNPEYAKNLGVRYSMFDDFARTRFNVSKRFESKSELGVAAHDYSAFVVGSDQLWLPSNIEGDYYTLNFVPDDVPKIALATSFGISRLPKAQAKKVAAFLPRIEFCSVRESSGQNIVRELTGRDVPVVCDPTILFTAEEWADIVPEGRFCSDKYIFCYFLGNNPEQREWVKQVAKERGLKIVQLQHCDEYIASDEDFADFAPYNVGPSEFIQLIRDAEIVMTDSFHCTVFSMLHKKQFFTFRRYNNDSVVSTNGRLYSLLKLVDLEQRLMRGDENVDDSLSLTIDYDDVHRRLDDLRQSTKAFLIEALDKSNIPHD